jgi:hypothetical protein
MNCPFRGDRAHRTQIIELKTTRASTWGATGRAALAESSQSLARLERIFTERYGSSAATKPTRIALGVHLCPRKRSRRLFAERRDQSVAAQQPDAERRRQREHDTERQHGRMHHARASRLLLR